MNFSTPQYFSQLNEFYFSFNEVFVKTGKLFQLEKLAENKIFFINFKSFYNFKSSFVQSNKQIFIWNSFWRTTVPCGMWFGAKNAYYLLNEQLPMA